MTERDPRMIDPQKLGIYEIEVPRDSRGRIRWKILEQDPDHLARFIESGLQQIIDNGISWTPRSLKETGFSAIVSAVHRYYPGKLIEMKKKLGATSLQKPPGYWKAETVEKEASEFLQEVGSLNSVILASEGRNDLAHAISLYYPGKLPGLRAKLAIPTLVKPRNYWKDIENIKTEAMEIYQKEGKLSSVQLVRMGQASLSVAVIQNYPGGWRGLRKDLKLKQVLGFWTPEFIEKEANDFYQQHGILTQESLRKHDSARLVSAITKYYPGGMAALKEKMGLRIDKRPDGFWTPENIEKEAQAFFEKEGMLTNKALEIKGESGLAYAIAHYPGGKSALLCQLGITTRDSSTNMSVSSADADEELGRLIEG